MASKDLSRGNQTTTATTPHLFLATITLHNVHVTHGVDHVSARQPKKEKTFSLSPFLSLQTLNVRPQDTLSLHLESTSNSKIFELVFCPWGRKRRRDERRKSFFEILILAASFLLLLVHSLACLQTQSNSDFYFEREQMRADERRQEKEREWGFLYAGSIRKKENNQPPKTEANHNRKREQHRNKKDQQFTNHSTKTNNNISCLRKRITKRTAPTFNSQTSPPKQVACGIEPQRSERKRGKRIFSFCSATATTKTSINSETHQSILLSSANNSLFFLRAGCNRSQPTLTTALSIAHRKRKMCCCGVEPQTAQSPNIKEEKNHPTVADSKLTGHALWKIPLSHAGRHKN